MNLLHLKLSKLKANLLSIYTIFDYFRKMDAREERFKRMLRRKYINPKSRHHDPPFKSIFTRPVIQKDLRRIMKEISEVKNHGRSLKTPNTNIEWLRQIEFLRGLSDSQLDEMFK